ncbi:copper resistance CopC/CopD family protein [Neobacillus vireti]|uniref:Copper resistance protein n=1 Tax=Neobacillus vireti LMG 21834 TaxID=1131730 RepID=A0AB94IFY2_9BACI|nr:copper resistance protein CopC [Neobacillus vireti]ETI66020.1 copper resistance protein [Neobacillus vireti LMG 21834]
MNIKIKISTFIVIISLFLFLFPTIFSAHAYIKKSTPFEDEILEKAPTEVMIQFNESIQPTFNSIKVFDSQGNRVDKENGGVDPSQPAILKSGLKPNLPDGTYRIKWKAVSSDGHPVQGVIGFQVGAEVIDSTAGINETQGYTPKGDLIIIRWLQYISNACYLGLLFFYMLIVPKAIQDNRLVNNKFLRGIITSFVALFLSIMLSLPLEATIEAGLPWNEVLSFQFLGNIIGNTTFGQTWIFQVIILLTLGYMTSFIWMAEAIKRSVLWVCFCLGAGLLLTKAFTSHAATQINPLLTISMDFIHLLAASIWIGSLIGFVVLLPLRKNTETKEYFFLMIKRFSNWGITLVLLLTLTGVFSSLLHVPNASTLIQTDYGKVLSSKVILFLLMLLLAAVNFIKGKRDKNKGLKVSLWGELSIGLVILVISVVLTNLPTAMQSPGPFKETKTLIHGNQVTLSATPNIVGENLFEVSLKDRQGRAIKDVEQIHLTFTMLDMDMGEETVDLKKVAEGKYEAQGLHFTMAGHWDIHVHVLTKSLESIDTDFRCLVGSQ